MEWVNRLLGLLPAAAEVGVLLAAGWLVTRLAERRAERLGLGAEQIESVAFWLGVGALIGARLPFVLARPDAYLANPLDLVRLSMGLSLDGALAGGLLVLGWFARRRGLPFWPVVDGYALALPLGIGLYRLGCLVRGDCYGRLAPPPFGVVFPGLTQPRFPAELYEAGLALALFGCLWWLDRRRPRPGALALAFFLTYPLAHAAVDATRIAVGAGPLSSDQLVSLAVAGAAGLVWLRWRRVAPAAGVRPAAPAGRAAHEQEEVMP